MKRRIMCLLLAFVLIVSLLPAGTMTALAAPAEVQRKSTKTVPYQTAPVKAQTKSSGTAIYSVPGGSIWFDTETGTVIDYEGTPTKLEIPATINGVKVVAIGEAAFWDCISLTEVSLPSGVTTIGDSAFAFCTNLTSITSVLNSLKIIGNGAFVSCDSLSRITIPDGVTTIGESAFYWCWGLKSVNIPSSVTSIGPSAFSSCIALEGIWVNENNPNYSSDAKGVLFNKNKSELLAYPGALYGSYTVPNSVRTICDYAFYDCQNLTAITFPSILSTIGDYAFESCYNLADIIFSNGLKTIGSRAFGNCDSLFRINIPTGVTTIGEDAFYWCWGLERVDIPASVTTIGSGAFSGCIELKGIWVNVDNPNYSCDNNGVLYNKNKTELLAYPTALTANYTVPDGVTTIGDSAFEDCYRLNTITFPESMTTIGDRAFSDCDALNVIALPDSVTSIGSSAFIGCDNLSAVAFSDNLKVIGGGAFELCNALSFLTLPNGVTTIGDYAFSYCEGLESMAIPASVANIGAFAFDGSPYLSHIYYGGTQDQWTRIADNYNDFSGITIHYNETAPWHSCSSIDFADTPFFNNWAHDGVDYCVENELMNGVGNNLFNPNGTVSRAQLVTILYRMAGSPETEFASTFTDVAEGLWYSDAIEWAAANGVVNGVGDGKFAPDQSITREQIATILYRYHGSPAVSGNLNSFPDAGSVRDYAVNSMLWATQEGLINGVSSNGVTSLAPQNNATRAQIASIIMRYCEAA